MKPLHDTLAIVTATVDPVRAADCFQSWLGRSAYHLPVYVVWSRFHGGARNAEERRAHQLGTNTVLEAFAPGVTIDDHLGGGVVPAFALGVARAFAEGAEAVLCLHDDVLLEEDGWDRKVEEALGRGVKFAGFGGAPSLGSASLYVDPYDPMQLARGGFVSNLRDAEAHGGRRRGAVPCVVFDGFCQIGTQDWFADAWAWLAQSGIQHHAYDAALGCLAQRAGVQPGQMIPVACHHFGGRTAVGDAGYQAWARAQHAEGDQGFWLAAHQVVYDAFRAELPLRLGGRV